MEEKKREREIDYVGSIVLFLRLSIILFTHSSLNTKKKCSSVSLGD